MPLVRCLRPAPDPDDPDTTGVAFRPREKEGARRSRSNNKKTFTLMAQLRDEFLRLRQLLEHVHHREKLKLEFHRAAGEYTEAAHRTLLNRLVRQRQDPRATWKDDELTEEPGNQSGHNHRKPAAAAAVVQPQQQQAHQLRHRSERKPERSHKKRHGLPGRPPKEAGASLPHSTVAVRDHSRDTHRVSHAATDPLGRSGIGVEGVEDEVDSEQEACNELLLTVNTAERDALEHLLPRHLRDAKPAIVPAQPKLSQNPGIMLVASPASAALTNAEPSTSTAGALIAVSQVASAAGEATCAAAAVMPSAVAEAAVSAAAAAVPESSDEVASSLRAQDGCRGGRANGGRSSSSGRLRGYVRVGRGGRIIFDRGGGGCWQYKHSYWTPATNQERSERLLQHVLATGRVCPPALLERHLDPDEAWRANKPLQIKHGPLLYNFDWLPKPDLVPSLASDAMGSSNEGGSNVSLRPDSEPYAATVSLGGVAAGLQPAINGGAVHMSASLVTAAPALAEAAVGAAVAPLVSETVVEGAAGRKRKAVEPPDGQQPPQGARVGSSSVVSQIIVNGGLPLHPEKAP